MLQECCKGEVRVEHFQRFHSIQGVMEGGAGLNIFWPCIDTNYLITVRENDTHSLTIDIGIHRWRSNISKTFKKFSYVCI